MNRSRFAVAVCAAVAIVVSACSSSNPSQTKGAATNASAGSGPTSSATSGSIQLYTSAPESIANALVSGFESAHPAIKVTVYRGTSGQVQARLATERQAGGIKADVLWLADPGPYVDYTNQGLLLKYSPPADAPIPKQFIDPNGYWVAGRVINMVVAWNTKKVPNGIKDWSDLNAPNAKAAFPAPTSGSALAADYAIQKNLDPDFFTKFKKNGGEQAKSNGDAESGLVSGTYSTVGILDYMTRADKAKGSPVDYAYPTSGTVEIPSPLAIFKASKNPQAAKAFIDYIISMDGQKLVVEKGSFYPVRTDVDPPAGTPPLKSLKSLPVDWTAMAKQSDQLQKQWSELFGG